MDFYDILIFSNNPDMLFPINHVRVEIILHSNEGAKPIMGGQGNPLIGFVGGKTYCSARLLDIADEIKNSNVPTRNVRVVLTNSDGQWQADGIDFKYERNDLLFESNNLTLIKFNTNN